MPTNYHLSERYNRILKKLPHKPKLRALNVYERFILNNEQAPSGAVYSAHTTNIGAWDELQKQVYNLGRNGGQIVERGHKGEVSCALELIKPNAEAYKRMVQLWSTDRTAFFKEIALINIGDGRTYDLEYEGSKYEVKELEVGGSVMVGGESDVVRRELLNRINQIVEIINNIPQEENVYLEKIKEIASIIKTKKLRETGRSMIDNIERGEIGKTVFAILEAFSEAIEDFLKNQKVDYPDSEIPKTAKELKSVYKDEFPEVDNITAVTADNKVRQVLSKKYDAGDKFFNFLDLCKNSVYSSKDRFENEVLSYFRENTPQSIRLLRNLFPKTGVFLVTPNEFVYAGFNYLQDIMVPANFTGKTIKVKRLDPFKS